MHFEATKAFKVAHFNAPDNLLILKDLSDSMLLVRDFNGYAKVRSKLLKAKPTIKPNWLSLVFGFHLSGKYQKALNTIDTFTSNSYKNPNAPSYHFHKSEILLYKNLIIEESGDISSARQHLYENRAEVYPYLKIN